MSGPTGASEAPPIGRRLKLLRVYLGRKSKDVAAAAGMTPQQFSRFENDDTNPQWATVERVTRALGVDLTRMLDEVNGKT